MGYTSDVRCLIYGPEEAITHLVASEQLLRGNKLFHVFELELTRYSVEINSFKLSNIDETDPGKGQTADAICTPIEILDLNTEGTLWDQDDEHVQLWDKFLELAEEVPDTEYEFIRVGEDYDDIVTYCTPGSRHLLSTTKPTIFAYIQPTEPKRVTAL